MQLKCLPRGEPLYSSWKAHLALGAQKAETSWGKNAESQSRKQRAFRCTVIAGPKRAEAMEGVRGLVTLGRSAPPWQEPTKKPQVTEGPQTQHFTGPAYLPPPTPCPGTNPISYFVQTSESRSLPLSISSRYWPRHHWKDPGIGQVLFTPECSHRLTAGPFVQKSQVHLSRGYIWEECS